MRDLAEARYLTPERFERASRLLKELARLVNPDLLAAALLLEEPTFGTDPGPALVFE